MHFDHIAEQRQEKNFAIWLRVLLDRSPEHLTMQLAAKHRPGPPPKAARRWKNGAFNICYQVKYEDEFLAIVRFTALGRTVFRREKVENEVVVMSTCVRTPRSRFPKCSGPGTAGRGRISSCRS